MPAAPGEQVRAVISKETFHLISGRIRQDSQHCHEGFEGHKVGGVKLACIHPSIVGMLLDKHGHDGMPDQCA